MKKILLGIISLLLIASVGYCQKQALQPTIKSDKGTKGKLFNKISPHLPNGWRCVEAPYGLNIFREKVVYTYNPISRPSQETADWEIVPRAYEPKIYFRDVFSKDSFNKTQQENKKIIETIDIFKEKMRHFAEKGDFRPKTDEDRKLFSEYKRLLMNSRYAELPDGYDGQHSYVISLEIYRDTNWIAFFDQEQVRECKEVLRLILKNMDTYIENREELLDAIFYGRREEDDYRYTFKQLQSDFWCLNAHVQEDKENFGEYGVESILGIPFGQICTIKAEVIEKPNTYEAQNISKAAFYLKILEINERVLKDPIIAEPVYGGKINIEKNRIYKFKAYERISSDGNPRGWSEQSEQFNYCIDHKIVVKEL